MALDPLRDNVTNAQECWEDTFQSRITFYDGMIDQYCGTFVPQEALSLVDDELRTLRTHLALFHRRINALRPVSRLSPELLSLVFRYAATSEPAIPVNPEVLDDEEKRRDFAPARTWVKVTHVCHAFRQCALGDRSLWHTITTVFGPEWMNTLIDRSCVPTRSMHVGSRTPRLSEIRSLLQQAHSVQITKLRSGDSLSESTIMLPKVRSLRIHPSDCDQGDWDTYEPVHAMPHLLDLHVHNVMDYNMELACINSHLTSLYIGTCRADDPICHPTRGILDALTKLPCLQRFTLAHCDLRTDDEITPRSTRVPALKVLDIEAKEFLDVAQLFDALEFSAGICVRLAGAPPLAHDGAEGWSSLEHALSHPLWTELHTLELLELPEETYEIFKDDTDLDDDRSVLFSAWREDNHEYVCRPGRRGDRFAQLRLGTTNDVRPNPDLRLQLMDTGPSRSLYNAVDKIFTSLRNATKLRTLSMRPSTFSDLLVVPWSDIFVHHPRLSRIRIDRPMDFDEMFQALYFVQKPLPVCELKSIYFPYKDEESPVGYWDERVSWEDPANESSQERGKRGALLASVMMQRAKAGAPILNIFLNKYYLKKQELWDALAERCDDQFLQVARRVFKHLQLWHWHWWGTGL